MVLEVSSQHWEAVRVDASSQDTQEQLDDSRWESRNVRLMEGDEGRTTGEAESWWEQCGHQCFCPQLCLSSKVPSWLLRG